MSLFCSGPHLGSHVCSAIMSPTRLSVSWFLRLVVLVMTRWLGGGTGEVFCGMPLSWVLADVFLIIRLRFWEEGHRGKVPSTSHHAKEACCQHSLSLWRWPWPPGWGCVCQVSASPKLLSTPFSSLEGSPCGTGHSQRENVAPPPFGQSIYIND